MSYADAPTPEETADSSGRGKPIPDQNDPVTKPFWTAVNARQLAIQQCQGCLRFYHPPVGLCWNCLSEALEFTAVSGKGRVYSFAVVRDQRQEAFDDLTPFVVATVELDDAPGVMLRSNLPGVPIDQVRSGMSVVVDYEEIAPGVSIPQFRAAHD